MSLLFTNWQQTPLIDFDHLQVSKKPHYCIVRPQCADERCIQSPQFTIPLIQLRNRWQTMIKHQPRTRLLKHNADDTQFQYVQRSKWFRFPDLIDVKFIALTATTSTLYAYSRSIYGYSDLGVNCKRMQVWLQGLQS